jgi:AcrR family transcriptional regulator
MSRSRAATFGAQRDAMLAAAARLFAERGFATASMVELAQALGVSKALLYHYYTDKEHLLFDIMDRYLDGLNALVDEVAALSLQPEPHLRRLIERFMDLYESSASYHRVLVQDSKYLSVPHRRRTRAKQRRVVDAVAAAVVALAPQLEHSGLLKPVTMVLFGMINWTFTWLREGGKLTYADLAPVVADLFLGGVMAVETQPAVDMTKGGRAKAKARGGSDKSRAAPSAATG